MPKSGSGKTVVKLLEKYYGFEIVGQKGSHVKLRKHSLRGTLTTVVPMHRELAFGTLRSVLKLADIDYEDFKKYL